jgi:hypothetical protein
MKEIVVLIFLVGFYSNAQVQRNDFSGKNKIAVLIIGSEMDDLVFCERRMNEIALFLESSNYQVHKFYHPNNSWEEIKKVSNNASIFVYQGHGTELGIDGGYGGLVLDKYVSGEMIARELKFTNHPIIFFMSVCGGAGSSAGDLTDIGVSLARKRVASSSLPFFLSGASAYYANNYYGGVLNCLKLMQAGKNLGEAFEITASEWTTIEKIESLNDNRLPAYNKIGIASSKGGGKGILTTTVNGKTENKEVIMPKGYRCAFVGNTGFKLNATDIVYKMP